MVDAGPLSNIVAPGFKNQVKKNVACKATFL